MLHQHSGKITDLQNDNSVVTEKDLFFVTELKKSKF